MNLKTFGDRLISLLPKLMQEILRYENNYVTTGKITCQQFLVLLKIAEKEVWRMNELAGATASSFPAMTGLISRLVNHKLVQRYRSEKDRRVVTVSITRKGRRIIDEVYVQKKKGIIRLFGPLNVREQRQYLEIVEKLVRTLSSTKTEESV